MSSLTLKNICAFSQELFCYSRKFYESNTYWWVQYWRDCEKDVVMVIQQVKVMWDAGGWKDVCKQTWGWRQTVITNITQLFLPNEAINSIKNDTIRCIFLQNTVQIWNNIKSISLPANIVTKSCANFSFKLAALWLFYLQMRVCVNFEDGAVNTPRVTQCQVKNEASGVALPIALRSTSSHIQIQIL